MTDNTDDIIEVASVVAAMAAGIITKDLIKSHLVPKNSIGVIVLAVGAWSIGLVVTNAAKEATNAQLTRWRSSWRQITATPT